MESIPSEQTAQGRSRRSKPRTTRLGGAAYTEGSSFDEPIPDSAKWLDGSVPVTRKSSYKFSVQGVTGKAAAGLGIDWLPGSIEVVVQLASSARKINLSGTTDLLGLG